VVQKSQKALVCNVCLVPKDVFLLSFLFLSNYQISLALYKTLNTKLLEDNQKKLAKPRVMVSKELNHLAAILHVYAGGLNFMK
jgi:hypothetical protein